MIYKITYDLMLAFIALIVATLFFYFIFARWKPLNKIQWKKMDYIWLGLTALGLIGLVEKNRIKVKQGELEFNKWKIEAITKDLNYNLNVNWICFQYIKTPNSPNNFDELQNYQDIVCSWSKKVLIEIKPKIEQNIKIGRIEKPTIKDKELEEYTLDIIRRINEYNVAIAEKNDITNSLKTNQAVSLVEWFSPLILILGLAIRFSKTAGEIRLEKNVR